MCSRRRQSFSGTLPQPPPVTNISEEAAHYPPVRGIHSRLDQAISALLNIQP